MCLFRSRFACLAAGAALCLAAVSAGAADLDKYLPDDTTALAAVNVKQITSWAPFQKQYRDPLAQLLKSDPGLQGLRDAGLDPLRDIDRVIVASAANSPEAHLDKPYYAKGVPDRVATSAGLQGDLFVSFVLAEGEFDIDKLQARAEQIAKDRPNWLKDRKVGDAHMWEVRIGGQGPPSFYLAALDKNTLMASLLESQATEALEKAVGRRETKLKNKQVRDGLAKMDPKAALEVIGAAETATTIMNVRDENGKFGAWILTLHDDGIEGLRGAVTLGDADFHVRLTITAKDADKAEELAKLMNKLLDPKAKVENSPDPKDWWRCGRAEDVGRDLRGLAAITKTLQVKASGDVVSLEGGGTGETLDAGVKGVTPAPSPPAKDK